MEFCVPSGSFGVKLSARNLSQSICVFFSVLLRNARMLGKELWVRTYVHVSLYKRISTLGNVRRRHPFMNVGRRRKKRRRRSLRMRSPESTLDKFKLLPFVKMVWRGEQKLSPLELVGAAASRMMRRRRRRRRRRDA